MSAESNARAGARLRAARKARGLPVADLAERFREVAPERVRARLPKLKDIERTIRGHEAGSHPPGPRYRMLWAAALDMDEAELFAPERAAEPAVLTLPAPRGDEIEALELARRAGASDVGDGVLDMLELAVDDLAVAYPGTPPAELLGRARAHLTYVGQLLDARKTLGQHRRLLVAGGWLSLLASTCHIDLREFPAAAARLRTAAQLAQQADHPEILAWCLETEAWQAITNGDYRRALALAQGAQRLAPHEGSAYIQATAQEGRAWARLGAGQETRAVLGRVEQLVSPLPMPDRPEHHYRYDPAKSDAYTATTLAWVGDTAAEPYARQVLARLESTTNGPPRPRRATSARLDLALALLAGGHHDEAADATMTAMTSGLLVPSNYWRAAEVVTAVETRRLPEAGELREAYREVCGPSEPADDGP